MIRTKRVKDLEQKMIEYENAMRVVELFLVENDLLDQFSAFVKSVVEEFEKSHLN
ncbi:hypothetical protein HPT25_28110 [Bacillus sp. BRMEA1]|uniref:hypothetical protein n=1 Tax=Neobacillus endophyticus TaxID=2738405 RepID=UPI0015635A80|nr:hypothetical protein [Neobacillus endophyticus]NRD81160.1 hypothetical protein [Neobacillus endophyticus]